MAYKFKATHISIQDEGDILTIGFADDEISPSKYLILQKKHNYDDQDKKLGMDKIYVEIGDQSQSSYGGVVSILQKNNKICFQLDDSASRSLKIDHLVDIDLFISDENVQRISEKLNYIADEEGIVFQRH